MSLPTTPVRSDAGCHLSSPSSAPNDDSPQQLTPRSKVKAMLAAIDNESDSEPIWESGNPVRTPLSTIAGNIQKTHIPKDVKHNVDAVADDEQGDSDEAPIVPRGILAARLNGQNIDRSGSGASSEECVEGNAYARIKKKLLQRGATKRHPSSPDTSDDVFEKKTAAPGASPQDLLATPYTTSNCANSTTNGPLSSQRSSPGLFVTPEQATRLKASSQLSADNGDSDSDLPANPRSNSRFLELVAKKRAEREAGEAAEVQKRKERAAGKQSVGEALSGDASSCSDHDSEVDRRLTQYARPTRKASKKALEEMNRETQRMSRNMQLAHQAKTKKKITKESLLARFNFRTSTAPIAVAPQNPSQSTTTSSAPASDREDSLGNATPPTSPIRPVDHSSAPVKTNVDKEAVPSAETSKPVEDEEEELPSMVDVMSQPIVKLDKGKGKAIEPRESNEMLTIPETKKTAFTQRPIRIRPPRPLSRASGCGSDSDSELEVIPDRKQGRSKVDVFDRLPTGKVQEGRSLQTLRALAHLNSPGEQGTKSCLSVADMSTSLQQQARKQAIAERAAKIEELKKRGIVIQTAEEREKDQAEVEDLVDKARKEAEDVMQKEKMAARKKKIANGEIYPLANSSGDDEEYQDIATDDSNVEFSGSDEEQAQNTGSDEERLEDEDDQEGGVAVDEDDSQKNGLIENEATEDFKDEGEIELMDDDNGDDNDKDDKQCIEPWLPRSRRKKMIIDDDKEDGEQDEKESEVIADPGSNQTPAVVVPQIPSAFGSFSAMGVPMGMTQAFAATMADTQSPVNPEDDEQDSMAFLGPPPEPNYPMFDDNDSLQVVEDSQDGLPIQNTDSDHSMAYKEIDLHFSQSQALNDAMGDSQGLPNATQLSDIPDPTQDVGFVLSSPAPERFVSVPQSTVDTVLLPDAASNASPVKKKRGRLQRRAVIEQGQYIIADNSLVAETNNSDSDAAANAFDMMKNARKKQALAKDAFDKKRSEAKGMVEEQAQESEDEYAGLGGASEDESGGEEDEYVKELIDQGEVIVNERQLAAHYA